MHHDPNSLLFILGKTVQQRQKLATSKLDQYMDCPNFLLSVTSFSLHYLVMLVVGNGNEHYYYYYYYFSYSYSYYYYYHHYY